MSQKILLKYIILPIVLIVGCGDSTLQMKKDPIAKQKVEDKGVSLVVLGNVQDAGSPHIACKKECCTGLLENPDPSRKVASLGLIDHDNQKTLLFDATPDIVSQLKELKEKASWEAAEIPNGIFLTHAHIGHYTGLMYLGKEAINANAVPTYVMPKMKDFLEQNGPWSQLVSLKNIDLHSIENGAVLSMTSNVKVVPLQVPHRDEFSETVGYKIIGPNKSALFIPDIDKWEKWATNISELVKTVDYAFLDATFFDGAEINNRDISQIPHPFVIESMAHFKTLGASDKKKIHFIHFNHTNPLLNNKSTQTQQVLANGFCIATAGNQINL